MMTFILRRKVKINMIWLWVFVLMVKVLFRVIGSLVMEIKVRTIISTTINSLGIEIGVKGEIVIRKERLITIMIKVPLHSARKM